MSPAGLSPLTGLTVTVAPEEDFEVAESPPVPPVAAGPESPAPELPVPESPAPALPAAGLAPAAKEIGFHTSWVRSTRFGKAVKEPT